MLTHLDENEQPTMVDVSDKKITLRRAVAQAEVLLPEVIWDCFDGKEIQSKKGPVLQTAIIAGTMAAKKTPDLIPLCHPLQIDSCRIEIISERPRLLIRADVRIEAKTGVEMEALVAANIAALTIYDMTKALSHDVVIEKVSLLEKSGGRRDYKR